MAKPDPTTHREGFGLVRWWLLKEAERRDISWDDIAQRLNVSLDDVRAWADGQSRPGPGEIRDLAEILCNPNHPSARRVLEDPVQRYLLADEVGLGKTVEAGAIIRQFLIGHGGGTVRIFVPSVIREQWMQEMNEKFDLDALDGTVTVQAFEAIKHASEQEPPDLVIIDEAQEIAQWAFADDDFVMTKEEWLTSLLDGQADRDDLWVVFASYPSVATRIHAHLQEALGERHVALYVEMSADDVTTDVETEVQRFREDSSCHILVCDRSAEVGRNLPFANHLLHYDLPWPPNCIEQRMGRLDRIGRRGRPMHTHVYLGADVRTGSIFEAWYHILADGIGAFRESMADLQFLIEKKHDDLMEQRFASGAEHVDAQVDALEAEIEEEREELERQHRFEELDAFEQTGGSYCERLQDLEEKSAKMQSDLDGWIGGALQFHAYKKPFLDNMLLYQPNIDGKTLVPFDVIMNRFLPRSGKPVSYHRSTVVGSRAETGTAASIFRVGHPFLDGLRDYFEWDDRGRVYAIWRQNNQWQALGQDDRLYFRFEFVLQADMSAEEVEDAGIRAALQRRADATFPPRFETVVTDRNGTPVTNDRLKDLVADRPKRAQDGGTDVNVKDDRLPLLDRFVDRLDWPNDCQRARDAAEDFLHASDAVVRQRDEALQRAESGRRDQIERLRLRAGGHTTGCQQDAYEEQIRHEKRIAAILRRSIETPSVRLDSVGAVILSGATIPTVDE